MLNFDDFEWWKDNRICRIFSYHSHNPNSTLHTPNKRCCHYAKLTRYVDKKTGIQELTLMYIYKRLHTFCIFETKTKENEKICTNPWLIIQANQDLHLTKRLVDKMGKIPPTIAAIKNSFFVYKKWEMVTTDMSIYPSVDTLSRLHQNIISKFSWVQLFFWKSLVWFSLDVMYAVYVSADKLFKNASQREVGNIFWTK